MGLLTAAWWCFFFWLGPMVAVDTHFTSRPQDFPEFRLTPWRAAERAGNSGTLTRDAIMPLTFRTLRYVQVSDDGGTTVETVAYHANVRWGPTAAALLASVLLPVIAYYGLRRLLR
jgi:hypothetical protein